MVVWIWVGLGALFGIIELFTSTFFGLWMAIAAIIPAAIVLVAPGIDLLWQIGIWCIATVCCAILWVKYSRNKPTRYVEEPLIGEVGHLAFALPEGGESVILLSKPGQGNQQWPCKSQEVLPRDARVKIVSVASGVVLVSAVTAE
ncbi:NfeD family protein [Providencia hangzhouensis]|uniref:NfeD family protein n=1 Tax=Providencia hangzhouensis TaxID=3031799 RepID=UPI00397A8266